MAAMSLVDRLRFASERLDQLQCDAANERRPHHQTEQLLDDIHGLGTLLCQIGRGRRRLCSSSNASR